MKALVLALIVGTAALAPLDVRADPAYYGSDTFADPDAPSPYEGEFRTNDGYDFGFYPERVPHVPSRQLGPFGRGTYALPSYRTPDTTTTQTDVDGRSTYTVMPPPPAYERESCVPRDYVDGGARRRRHVKVYRIERTYRYRIVAGTAIVIPPPCGRVVGILTPAH